MIQKPLLWVEVGKSACVLVGICDQSLSLFEIASELHLRIILLPTACRGAGAGAEQQQG
jgi:hypothetical protein